MTPEENLAAAAEYISEHGHTKGDYFEGNASLLVGGGMFARTRGALPSAAVQGRAACALGAIWATADTVETAREADTRFHVFLSPSKTWTPVGAWNDEPERTAEDVILALKEAAYGDD